KPGFRGGLMRDGAYEYLSSSSSSIRCRARRTTRRRRRSRRCDDRHLTAPAYPGDEQGMRPATRLTLLALPLLFVACQPPEPASAPQPALPPPPAASSAPP